MIITKTRWPEPFHFNPFESFILLVGSQVARMNLTRSVDIIYVSDVLGGCLGTMCCGERVGPKGMVLPGSEISSQRRSGEL